MNSIQIKAPAKINLGLNITGKRLDGYHNILTLFYPLHDLYDTIKFTKDETTSLHIDKRDSELKNDNLIIRAVELVEKYTRSNIGVRVELEKQIPVGAGMGGGSSDAAATLISLNELFSLDISDDLLYGLALKLGSDVPFFIKAKTAIGKSRGEVLTPVNFLINYPIVVINPGIHISTSNIFAKLKTFSTVSDFNISSPADFNDIKSFGNIFINDFENIVFEDYPEVGAIKEKLKNCGAGFASMTGTGSTVFGVFKDIDMATEVLKNFPENYFKFISLPQEELM